MPEVSTLDFFLSLYSMEDYILVFFPDFGMEFEISLCLSSPSLLPMHRLVRFFSTACFFIEG